MARKDDRFIKVYSQWLGSMQVWVDRVTGVNYLVSNNGYGGGITPLLDRDGKSVVTPLPMQYSETR